MFLGCGTTNGIRFCVSLLGKGTKAEPIGCGPGVSVPGSEGLKVNKRNIVAQCFGRPAPQQIDRSLISV